MTRDQLLAVLQLTEVDEYSWQAPGEDDQRYIDWSISNHDGVAFEVGGENGDEVVNIDLSWTELATLVRSLTLRLLHHEQES